jgi:hypothetical protein
VTSPLDDISYKLGELSAGQAMLLQRMDKNEVEHAETKKLLSSINTKLDAVVDDVLWMKPQATHYAGVRKRAAWLNTLVVAAVSICGSATTAWFLKKYGG